MVVQMIRHVIPIHVKLVVLQAILMVVQEILMKNMKPKKMTITLTLHLKKDNIYYKLQEEIMNRLLLKFFIKSNQFGYV